MSKLRSGRPGETYNVGGSSEKANIEVVTTICETLDELVPDSQSRPHSSLIKYVMDRPGHDRRYAIDATKLRKELGWQARETFSSGIRKTVQWYLSHTQWLESVDALIALGPEHASLYILELYPNAPLRDAMARSKWSLAPDDDANA